MIKEMFKSSKLISAVFIITLVIICLPLLRPGFFSVHDETHIVDLYEMYRAWQIQGFPPRWAPDFNFGLGHPYFNFYYQLPFYITSLLMFLGFSMTDSYKYLMLICVISAVAGFYFFAKNHVSKISALVAAAVYIFSPYFAVDLYVRGALGELALFGLIPWAGFTIFKLLNKRSKLNFVLAVLMIGGLSLAHNVLNIFVFPFLFGYGLMVALSAKEFKKGMLILLTVFLAGGMLASFYLIPALMEKQYISNYEQINLFDHFPFIKQLIIPFWGYGVSVWGPYDGLSFNIGTINLILLVLSLVFFKFISRNFWPLLFYCWVVFVTAVLLMNQRSYFLWNAFQMLHYIQFPWRMLMFATIVTSLVSGIIVEQLLIRFKKYAVIIPVSIIVIVFMLNVGHYHPSEYKQIADEKYLELYFANRTLKGDGIRGSLSQDYLNFTEDFIPPTKWELKRPKELPVNTVEALMPAKIDLSYKNLSYLLDVDSEKENVLYFNLAYFPGWEARVDGAEVTIFPAKETGIIGLNIQQGRHMVNLDFKNTPIRILANWLSLTTAFILTGFLVVKKNQFK